MYRPETSARAARPVPAYLTDVTALVDFAFPTGIAVLAQVDELVGRLVGFPGCSMPGREQRRGLYRGVTRFNEAASSDFRTAQVAKGLYGSTCEGMLAEMRGQAA